jgi:hypothetical protein
VPPDSVRACFVIMDLGIPTDVWVCGRELCFSLPNGLDSSSKETWEDSQSVGEKIWETQVF